MLASFLLRFSFSLVHAPISVNNSPGFTIEVTPFQKGVTSFDHQMQHISQTFVKLWQNIKTLTPKRQKLFFILPISFYTFAILYNTFVIPFFKIAKVFFIFPIPFNKIAIFYNTFAIPFFKIAKVEIVFLIPFIVFAISFNTFAIPFNTFGILFFKTGCFEAIFKVLFVKSCSLFFVIRQKKGYLYADSRNDFPHLKKSLKVFRIF